MKTKFTNYLLGALVGVASTAALHAQTSAFTYQGQLTESGVLATGLYDFEFTLYDASGGGAVVAGPVTNSPVAVSNGVFTVMLDFGASVFDGSDRWVEIGVVTNGGGAFGTLSPRQQLTATPYAVRAANAINVAMGTISNPSFFGTTTTTPLQLQVNNTTGLRLEYPAVGTVPILVGGYAGNRVGASSAGAVVVGGGTIGGTNSIGSSSGYSFIGSGYDNQIGDNSFAANIVGGQFNSIGIDSDWTALGGGVDNSVADGIFAGTIGGGSFNRIGNNANYSSINGGVGNQIESNAPNATIAGGSGNLVAAGASYAFAAGRHAQANHPGAFVWADSENTIFPSTSNNQFNIRAAGGARFVTGGAGLTVDGASVLAGTVPSGALSGTYSGVLNLSNPASTFNGTFTGNGSGLTGLNSLDAADGSPTDAIYVDNAGKVGIGTINPGAKVTISRATQAAEHQLELRNEGSIQMPNFDGIRFTQDGDGSTELASINVKYRNNGRPDLSFSLRDQADALFINGNNSGRSGNVGIGTTTPERSLDVAGEIVIDNNEAYAARDSGGVVQQMLLKTPNDETQLSTAGGQDIIFKAGTNINMVITGDGDVGIGTDNPLGRLHIDGGIVAKNLNAGSSNSLIGPSSIAGGWMNSINTIFNYYNFIGAGSYNAIVGPAMGCVIGGGSDNAIQQGVWYSVIGGGDSNTNQSYYSFIGGGGHNIIATGANYSVVLGGFANHVESGAPYSLAAGKGARANHPGSFVWADSANPSFPSISSNQFNVRSTGGVRFVTAIDGSGAPTSGVSMGAGGNGWAMLSDRNAKKDFASVNTARVLEQLARIPIQYWRYKWEQESSTPHIGPMAQDFKRSFYPGRDDKTISTVEFDGVALAAIQGLNQKVESGDQKAEIRMSNLEAENAELKARLEKLEQLLNDKLNGGVK